MHTSRLAVIYPSTLSRVRHKTHSAIRLCRGSLRPTVTFPTIPQCLSTGITLPRRFSQRVGSRRATLRINRRHCQCRRVPAFLRLSGVSPIAVATRDWSSRNTRGEIYGSPLVAVQPRKYIFLNTR